MRDIIKQDWICNHPGNIDDINRACTRWLARRGIESGGMKQIIKASYRAHKQNKDKEREEDDYELNDQND